MNNRERIIALADEDINYRNMVTFKPVLMEIKQLAEDDEEYYATQLVDEREDEIIEEPEEELYPVPSEPIKAPSAPKPAKTYTDEEWMEDEPKPKKERKYSSRGGRKVPLGRADKELLEDAPKIVISQNEAGRKVQINKSTWTFARAGETDEECRARFLAKYKNSFKY